MESYSDLYFIIGSDILYELHRWKSWKEIVKLTKLIVFSRKGYDKKRKEFIVLKYFKKDKQIKLMQVSEIKKNIEKILDNNKAQSITSINLRNKSYIADYMIIASGTSSRHLQSLSEILVSELKRLGLENCRIEGKDSKDWKLVDADDVIVHIFHPEKREFYDLEKMWSEEIPKEKALI